VICRFAARKRACPYRAVGSVVRCRSQRRATIITTTKEEAQCVLLVANKEDYST